VTVFSKQYVSWPATETLRKDKLNLAEQYGDKNKVACVNISTVQTHLQ